MNKTNRLVLGIMMMPMLIAMMIVPATAQDQIFHFVPNEISADPGEEVTVWLYLTGTEPIRGFQAATVYDQNVVECINVVEGTDPDWTLWTHRGTGYPTSTGKEYFWFDGMEFSGGHGPGEVQCGFITLKGVSEGVTTLYCTEEPEIPNLDNTTVVADVGGQPLTWVSETLTFTCGGAQTFTKDLPAGWNLISLPLTPTDNSVSAVLSSVEQNAVKRYDATSKEFVDITTTMDLGTGYFVHVTTASTWSYPGTPESSTTSELKSGLNMIGVPNCGMSVSDVMGATEYRYAARWNAISQSYEVYNPNAPEAFHGFNTMEPGEGYFVSAGLDSILTVTCP